MRHVAHDEVFRHQNFRSHGYGRLVYRGDYAYDSVDVDVYLMQGLVYARRGEVAHEIAESGAYRDDAYGDFGSHTHKQRKSRECARGDGDFLRTQRVEVCLREICDFAGNEVDFGGVCLHHTHVVVAVFDDGEKVVVFQPAADDGGDGKVDRIGAYGAHFRHRAPHNGGDDVVAEVNGAEDKCREEYRQRDRDAEYAGFYISAHFAHATLYALAAQFAFADCVCRGQGKFLTVPHPVD